MSTTDAINDVNSERSSAILPTVFFLSPLLTAAIPKLTWLFLILVPAALIGRAFRRSDDWRGLILPYAENFCPGRAICCDQCDVGSRYRPSIRKGRASFRRNRYNIRGEQCD